MPLWGRGEKYPDVGDCSWFSLNVWPAVLNCFYSHCYKRGYLRPLGVEV